MKRSRAELLLQYFLEMDDEEGEALIALAYSRATVKRASKEKSKRPTLSLIVSSPAPTGIHDVIRSAG